MAYRAALAFLVAAALPLSAEDPAKLSEGLPAELAMIVDGALAVPPELGAEALIRAAASRSGASTGGVRYFAPYHLDRRQEALLIFFSGWTRHGR